MITIHFGVFLSMYVYAMEVGSVPGGQGDHGAF